MLKFRIVGAVIGAIFLSTSAVVHADSLKEEETGVVFRGSRNFSGYKGKAVGTAVREKFSFDVYAACLYIDAKRGKKRFLKFLASPKSAGAYANGKLDVDKLRSKSKFYSWLIWSDLPMRLEMKFMRDVDGEKIRDQFKESIARSLKPKHMAARDKLLGAGIVDMKKNKRMILTLAPGGRVTLTYMGKKHETVKSRPLARALLGMYFGRRPIGKEIKADLVSKIDRLLQ